MKKILYRKIFATLVIALIFTSLGSVYAQSPAPQPPANPGEYNFLVPLPGVPATSNLTTYIPAIIKLTIGIAAVLAFIMITFGGIRYATADAIGAKEDGKKHIENALWGLILVIGAYAILNTLNPKMLSFDFSTVSAPGKIVNAVIPGSQQVSPNPFTGAKNADGTYKGYTLSPDLVAVNKRIREQLGATKPNAIIVNNDPCVTGLTQGCTNVVGLPQKAITGLVNLETSCECLLKVTGGTEGGHAEHAPNLPVFDLSPDQSLNTYLSKTNPEAKSPRSGTCVYVDGASYKYENTGDNGRSSAPHWHVSYAEGCKK